MAMLRINVTLLASEPDTDDDAEVEGLYEVDLGTAGEGLPLPKLASAALDVFHESIAIDCLDDFDIDVVGPDGSVIEEDPDHSPYSWGKQGHVSKLSDSPLRRGDGTPDEPES